MTFSLVKNNIYWGINYKCLVSRSLLHYIVHMLHHFSLQSQGRHAACTVCAGTVFGRFGFKKSIEIA